MILIILLHIVFHASENSLGIAKNVELESNFDSILCLQDFANDDSDIQKNKKYKLPNSPVPFIKYFRTLISTPN